MRRNSRINADIVANRNHGKSETYEEMSLVFRPGSFLQKPIDTFFLDTFLTISTLELSKTVIKTYFLSWEMF